MGAFQQPATAESMLIDWFTVCAQIVNFLVLVWLLKKFLEVDPKGWTKFSRRLDGAAV